MLPLTMETITFSQQQIMNNSTTHIKCYCQRTRPRVERKQGSVPSRSKITRANHEYLALTRTTRIFLNTCTVVYSPGQYTGQCIGHSHQVLLIGIPARENWNLVSTAQWRPNVRNKNSATDEEWVVSKR